ncbi:thioredoxin family protein [Microbacterium sp. 179-I 3D3 NHS]|uniref:thioredoxin family protein n=1 Tax=Microbacterium sp. 179-I 3D3 NHS TaxID=3142382 RepID=UPI0039A16DA0
MSPALAAIVAVGLVGLAVIIGLVLRRRDGRRRAAGVTRFDPADAGAAGLGSHVTLVQFSTELCARCPHVRRMLRAVAAEHPGIRHVEVDLTHRPDLASRYRVLQTPTTLVVDDGGAVRARFPGVPQRHAVTDVVASL